MIMSRKIWFVLCVGAVVVTRTTTASNGGPPPLKRQRITPSPPTRTAHGAPIMAGQMQQRDLDAATTLGSTNGRAGGQHQMTDTQRAFQPIEDLMAQNGARARATLASLQSQRERVTAWRQQGDVVHAAAGGGGGGIVGHPGPHGQWRDPSLRGSEHHAPAEQPGHHPTMPPPPPRRPHERGTPSPTYQQAFFGQGFPPHTPRVPSTLTRHPSLRSGLNHLGEP